MNLVLRPALLLVLSLIVSPLWALDAPAPADFAWRATLALPAGASVARVTLPPEAMLQLQSPDARDVRVFNADGEAVAHAFTTPAGAASKPVPVQTGAYAAHALFSAASGQRPAQGSVAIHLDQAGNQRSVWVHMADSAVAPGATHATALPSALFDTRREKQTISALTLQAELPANALIHFTVDTSTDLAQWTPVEVRGPVFRFDGAGAPNNPTLELMQPLRLEGHYLRLNWQDQNGVQMRSVTGSVAPAEAAPARVLALLPAGKADGNTSIIWSLPFATPLAALQLSSSRNNTLIPVRILGRNDAAQPWRQLAQTVIYRVGAPGQEKVNPPVDLGSVSVRWLRVEASHGMALPGTDVQATLAFEPAQLVFMATGKAPFELAVGRSGTTATAVQASLIRSVVTGKLEDLPVAELSNSRLLNPAATDATLTRFLPAGVAPRSLWLWVILLAGVLILAAVAYGLLRQLSAKSASQTAESDTIRDK